HSHNLYEQNSHVICELGLSVINHLTQKEPDLQRTNHACTSCLQRFTNLSGKKPELFHISRLKF
ncbi:unnamed protein product, partial [Brassica oleracea var. botrytis]